MKKAVIRDVEAVELSSGERRLLRSYVNGPRIWDAAELLDTVVRLQAKGLVVPLESGASMITDAGLAAVAST